MFVRERHLSTRCHIHLEGPISMQRIRVSLTNETWEDVRGVQWIQLDLGGLGHCNAHFLRECLEHGWKIYKNPPILIQPNASTLWHNHQPKTLIDILPPEILSHLSKRRALHEFIKSYEASFASQRDDCSDSL